MMRAGFLDPEGGGKNKKNTKQGNCSSGLLMVDVESFPPLHDHMVSSSGGEFVVEQGFTSIRNTSIEGYVSTGLPTSISIKNTTTTPMCEPSEGDDKTRKVTVSLDVAKENDSSPTFSSNIASVEGVEYVLRNGPSMIHGIPIFLNKWSPSVSLLKEELCHVLVWVKFFDLPLVVYTSDGLTLMATKIGTLMMLHFDQLVMAVPNMEENGYTKETIRIEYEWEPLCCSTCLIFGHSIDDCLKAPKATKVAPIRVVNQKDKGKGQTSGADDEGFIKVKKKKLGGNNGSTKNFTFSVKPKTQYRPKAKQSSEGTSLPKTIPFIGTNKASTSGYNKESTSNKGNTFSPSNSFEALNDENLIIEEVGMGSMATTSEKHILEGKLVLVDDDEKPLEKVDYPANLGNDNDVEPVDNEIETLLASKPMGVGYGMKNLFEQWRESNIENDYDPYDDDMHES
ncbi:zinc knuckle CX2CX4HX4C containing protein [Tanacetum coccineum]